MTYKMFIDDERDPVENDWIICRSYNDVFDHIAIHGCPIYISFDHDLGDDELTGYQIAHKLIEMDMDSLGKFIPMDFAYFTHSQNPVGKRNIEQLINQYIKLRMDFWD